MIQGIDIENFQSHNTTSITFHPGVNVITGKSDNGKSVIIRAIKWLKDNNIRDKGDKGTKVTGGIPYASDWIKTDKGAIKKGKEVSVTLHKDNHTITRYRNSESNGYKLDDLQEEAIGTDIPHKIVSLLNMDAVNMQRQFDSPFLISYSAGDVSKFFNRIVKLETIDKATSSIDSRKRATNADIKVAKAEIVKLDKAISDYAWVPSADKQLLLVEKADKVRIKKQVEYNALANLMDVIYEKLEEIEECPNTIKADKLLSKISNSFKAYTSDTAVYASLSETVSAIRHLDNEISYTTAIAECAPAIEKLSKIAWDAGKLVTQKGKLTGVYQASKEFTQDLEDVSESTASGIKVDIKYLEKLKNKIDVKEKLADTLQIIYNNITRLIKDIAMQDAIIIELEIELPDICPLCGNTFTIG